MANYPRPHGFGMPEVVAAHQRRLEKDQRQEGLDFRKQQFEETKAENIKTNEYRANQLLATKQAAGWNRVIKFADLGYKYGDEKNFEYASEAFKNANKLSKALGLDVSFSATTDKALALKDLRKGGLEKLRKGIKNATTEGDIRNVMILKGFYGEPP